MIQNAMWVALIPAYEPKEDELLCLLGELRGAGLKAIVVDDGSGPAFSNVFKRAAGFAVILTHPENLGKGRAIKTGLQCIKENLDGDYIVVTMDSDGQHQASDAVRVCQLAQSHRDALVLGSRALQDNVPLRSRFGNTVTRFIYSLSTGVRVHDTQTGLRAFSGALLPLMLDIGGERYEYEMNVLLECARRKIPMEEIGISTIYVDNNENSHFDTLKDSYRVYKEIIKFSASSLIGFLVDYSLFGVLTTLTAGLGTAAGVTVSNILARMVSSNVNFAINRKLVFQSEKSLWKSAAQYFALAAAILAGNTLLLNVLVRYLGMNRYASKLMVEMLFFILSWLVQKFFIFRKGGGGRRDDQHGNES